VRASGIRVCFILLNETTKPGSCQSFGGREMKLFHSSR
jgi:hypothetical protein